VRSASFQFSGKPSQCVGNEPVVVDVHAYAGDGRADVADTQAGSRIAQLSADCSNTAASRRPIDVTAIVRQLSVASGVPSRRLQHQEGQQPPGAGAVRALSRQADGGARRPSGRRAADGAGSGATTTAATTTTAAPVATSVQSSKHASKHPPPTGLSPWEKGKTTQATQ
jgi:hypothetical protein